MHAHRNRLLCMHIVRKTTVHIVQTITVVEKTHFRKNELNGSLCKTPLPSSVAVSGCSKPKVTARHIPRKLPLTNRRFCSGNGTDPLAYRRK